jgi:hypothetical protein
MKNIIKLIFINLCFFLLAFTCVGDYSYFNAYESYVVVHITYEHDNNIIERSYEFSPERGVLTRDRYNNLIAIRIESLEGEELANYTLEYLTLLRNAYQSERRREDWIFSEKGLFMSHPDSGKRSSAGMYGLEYYRSDEAVQYLQMLLSQMLTD